MPKLLLLAALAVASLFATPKTASAQIYYQSVAFSNYGSYHTFTPQAPRAGHDNRIDSHLIRAAHLAESHAARHSTLRCWKFVKNALLEAGAVSAYPATNYACQAGSELVNRYGFVRLPIRDPYRAPLGAVCVYGGGGAGHVELRTEHGFASDYRTNWRCKYPLIGVYAKIS